MTALQSQMIPLAKQALKLGDVKQCINIVKQILNQNPNDQAAKLLLSEVQEHLRQEKLKNNEPSSLILDKASHLVNQARYKEACKFTQQQLRQYPKSCYLREFLSQSLAELGYLEEAKSTLLEAIQIDDRNWSLFNNLALLLSRSGNVDQSLGAYLNAIRLNPENEEIQINAGASLINLDDKITAIKYFEKLINAWPHYSPWYAALGNLLCSMGEMQNADKVLEAGAKVNNQDANLLCNLGVVKHRLGKLNFAIECFEQALKAGGEIDLNEANIGHAYMQSNNYEKAAEHFRTALTANPENTNALYGTAYSNSHLCNWSNEQKLITQLSEEQLTEHIVSPFHAIALDDNPYNHLIRNRHYANSKNELIQQKPIDPITTINGKIKLGYFSSDYHNHATMHLMIRMFEAHSDAFEVHIFSYDRAPNDNMRQRLIKAVHAYHDINHMSDEQAATYCRDLGIHIAIDLKGYTANSRSSIMAHRAAPIQIAFLGYPGTMGTDDIDYMVADMVLIPEDHQQYYDERIIYMPASYQINDNSRSIAKATDQRSDHGLPEKGFVFCCFNNNYKITADEFSIWMRLLNQTPDSVLWLLSGNPIAENNLKQYAEEHGVTADRLVFAQRTDPQSHLNRQTHADLFLDTFNCNAHTTMSDTLWAGVPAITKIGNSFASRVGASLLNAVDMPDLITTSEVEYESLALKLCQNKELLQSYKQHLCNNRLSLPLFDTEAFTSNMEKAYIQSIDIMIANRKAQHIYL